jgi:pimeloyl-ACP methyl ester carboxylesterase
MKGSILFVHGAGHAAWCWRDHFTGWFEASGYTAHAPDLPGHGALDRAGVKTIPLRTYVDTVAAAAKTLPRPLILIGHSMGGFIIQKLLETEEADVAVLLASTPPTGALGMVRRMATRRPRAFLHTLLTSEGSDSPQTTREYFFSPETSEQVVSDVHRRLQPESSRALRDMMSHLHPERVNTPVVVMGARNDWLVAPSAELMATARAFNTAPISMPGGHDMMLDFAWEQVAAAIERSIVEQLEASAKGSIPARLDR